METQQSDPVTAKNKRNSGRLSRKEKSVINAAKSEKDKSPSAISQSTERTQLLNENPSKKDKKTEQSGNKKDAVVGPLDKTETSNSTNIIDKKSNESFDNAMQPSDRLNQKESASTKLSSKSSPEKIMKDQDKDLDALSEGGDSNPTIRDTGEDSRQTDKKHQENDTKHEEEDSSKLKANIDETKSSSEKDAEPISKDSSQDSAKPRLSKPKSRNKRKKNEKKPNDSIAESDIEGGFEVNTETVQATCSTPSESNKKDMVKSDETNEEPNLSETEIGRIRKRGQAVNIENPKDDLHITPQNENQSIAGVNSEKQVPLPESVESDTPIMKIPTKTYLMCTKNKTSLLSASEDPDIVLEPQKLITTSKGDSNPDLDNANNLETSSTQDPKEHEFSDQTFTDNSDIIPSCTKKSQIVFPTTPTKSSDQTKNSFITPNRSAKSKRNVSKEAKRLDNSFEESQNAASNPRLLKSKKNSGLLQHPVESCVC